MVAFFHISGCYSHSTTFFSMVSGRGWKIFIDKAGVKALPTLKASRTPGSLCGGAQVWSGDHLILKLSVS